MRAVQFAGEEFTPREKTNRMRSLYLAKLARDGVQLSSDDDQETKANAIMSNMAALYELVQHVLRPEDFDRFMAACDREGVTDDAELYRFTGEMMAAVAERPTEQPSDSSPGPGPDQESSVSRLGELAGKKYPGRPDLWLAVTASERSTEEAAV